MSKGLVLVVDDEKNILNSLEGILHDDGYDVMTMEEGESALSTIESAQPDLVLLDIWLPGMDGIEVLKSAKRRGTETEFIMMSGHGSIDTAVQATKLGAFDFIEKPLSLEDILLVAKLAIAKKNKRAQDGRTPAEGNFERFAGISEEAERIREKLRVLWRQDRHITITGEAGTGKSLVADILHSQIQGAALGCVKVDCSKLAKRQANKVLFGVGRKDPGNPSQFELAENGTLILDGLDCLPSNVQLNILRALKDRKLPGIKTKQKSPFTVRIVAVLSHDYQKKIKEGSLHRDLMEALSAENIFIPPLRKHLQDLEPLANLFLSSKTREFPHPSSGFLGQEALEILRSHSWPGNAGEFKEVVEEISRSGREGMSPGDLEKWIQDRSPKPVGRRPCVKKDLSEKGRTAGEMKQGREALDAGPSRARQRSPQKTLKKSVILYGHGLHSGTKTGLILSPLPPDSGIVFCDISTGETIRARLENVSSTDYATGLRKGNKIVRTVEHILAALHVYGLNNLLIKMEDEVPIMDGSASNFCEVIEEGGVEEQGVLSQDLVIDRTYALDFEESNGKFLCIEPAESLSISYTLDYPSPIGHQNFVFECTGKDCFRREIAPARTFGFLKDYEKLEEMGLATGGRLSNLILLDEGKVLNTTLRFPDEFVRHKILDIIGDFYLLGRPVKGKITASMTGHRENIALLKKIQKNHPGFF